MSNGGCDHTCDNDEGSFECHCNDGFMLEEDGFTCKIQKVIEIILFLCAG